MAFITKYKGQHNAGAMSKAAVKYIVLHRTEGHIAGDLRVLQSGGGRSVSIHFLIGRDGKIYKMLPMSVGANHAGYGHHGLAAKYGNANHHAYGIELSGMGNETYPTAQLKALDTVVAYIDKYLGRKVPITTHAAIDPDRKSDPRHFTWLDEYNKYRHYRKPVVAKPVAKPVVAVKAKPKVVTYTTTTALNLRKAPISGKVIEVMPKGAKVKRVGSSILGWVKVSHGAHVGYARNKYLK